MTIRRMKGTTKRIVLVGTKKDVDLQGSTVYLRWPGLWWRIGLRANHWEFFQNDDRFPVFFLETLIEPPLAMKSLQGPVMVRLRFKTDALAACVASSMVKRHGCEDDTFRPISEMMWEAPIERAPAEGTDSMCKLCWGTGYVKGCGIDCPEGCAKP